MRNLFIIIPLILLSCQKEVDIKQNIVKTWIISSVQGQILNEPIDMFADSMYTPLKLIIQEKSLTLMGCNASLGSSNYTLNSKGDFSVDNLLT